MSDLPDDFKCTITNWEYIYGLCRDVSDDVKASEFEPDVVVALARGGWFAGRCLCDFLGLDDLTSLKMEHYVGTAQKSGEPEVRNEIRTATLQLLGTSEYDPDYVGEYLDEWTWVVYPWNFIEDMVDLVSGVMEKDGDGPYTREDIQNLLSSYHDVGRIEMEIAQPDRLDEVLAEMVRRDVLVKAGDAEWKLRVDA